MKFDIMPVVTEKQLKEIADSAESIWKDYLCALFSDEKAKYLLKQLQSKEVIYRKMKKPGYNYTTLLVDDIPVGLLAFAFVNHAVCIDTLYLNKEARHKGVVYKVLNYLDDFCHYKEGNCDFRRILVYIPLKDLQTITLFEHLGFSKIGHYEYAFRSSFGMECCVMERIPVPKKV